jgi:hypothetical protein
VKANSGIHTDVTDQFIVLEPWNKSGTLMTSADIGQQIGAWPCGPTSTDGIPENYLPGSCRIEQTSTGTFAPKP